MTDSGQTKDEFAKTEFANSAFANSAFANSAFANSAFANSAFDFGNSAFGRPGWRTPACWYTSYTTLHDPHEKGEKHMYPFFNMVTRNFKSNVELHNQMPSL
jgi:hypothetical protein